MYQKPIYASSIINSKQKVKPKTNYQKISSTKMNFMNTNCICIKNQYMWEPLYYKFKKNMKPKTNYQKISITMTNSTPSSGRSNWTRHLLWSTVRTLPSWISLVFGWIAVTRCPTDKGLARSVGSPSLVPEWSSV